MQFVRMGSALLASAAVAALMPGAAQAQAAAGKPSVPAPDAALQAASPGNGNSGDIIVTARRRAESLQTVPVAVTAISTKELAERSTQDIADVAKIAPSLQIGTATRGAGVADISLRGQENTGTAITNDPAVGIYFDEVYLGRSAGNLLASLQDMASVQVLRGPQGTLFGRNNTGGAILLTPNRPDLNDFSGSFDAKYGSYDFFELGAIANVPIVEGSLGIRGSFMRTRRDGIGKSVVTGIDSFGDRHRDSGRAAARWKPSDAVTFDFTYDFANVNETGPLTALSVVPAGVGFYQTTAGIQDPYSKVHTKGYTFRSEVAINPDTTLKTIIGRRFVKTSLQSDIDNTAAPLVDANQFANVNQWTAEVQLAGTFAHDATPWLNGISYTAGGFYFVEKGNDSSILPVPVGTYLGTGRTLENLARNESTAGYAQIETNSWDKLYFTLGGRYTKDNRSLTIRTVVNSACALQALPAGTPIDLCFQSGNAKFGYWSYSFGGRYEFSRNLNVYLKFDRGQRAGGLDDTPTSIVPFNPEVVKSVEAGIKWTGWDHRLRANLAVYNMNIDNVQRVVLLIEPTTNSPYSSVFNAAKSRVRGIELDASVEPVRGLTLSGTLGLMDPKYRRFINPADGVTDLSNLDFPSTPKTTYSLSGAYRTQLSDNLGLLMRADWSHRSKQNFDVFNSPLTEQKAYGLLDARIQFDIDKALLGTKLTAAVFGRNLTNTRYNSYGSTAVFGFYSRNDDRRTIGVELTADF